MNVYIFDSKVFVNMHCKCIGRKVARETLGFNLLTWVAIVAKHI